MAPELKRLHRYPTMSFEEIALLPVETYAQAEPPVCDLGLISALGDHFRSLQREGVKAVEDVPKLTGEVGLQNRAGMYAFLDVKLLSQRNRYQGKAHFGGELPVRGVL